MKVGNEEWSACLAANDIAKANYVKAKSGADAFNTRRTVACAACEANANTVFLAPTSPVSSCAEIEIFSSVHTSSSTVGSVGVQIAAH